MQAFVARLQLEHPDHLPDELGKSKRPHLEGELAPFDPGNVQRAFDQGQQMLATFLDHPDRIAPLRRDRIVAIENLGVAENTVQRCAQLMADRGHITAFRSVGALSQLLGTLQGQVGALVRLDLLHQQARLAIGLLLRHLPALVGQYHPPGAHPTDQEQHHEYLEKHGIEGACGLGRR